MSQFIYVTNTKGAFYFVNIDHIIFIEPYKSDAGKMVTQIILTPRFPNQDNYIIADIPFEEMKKVLEKK